MGMILVIPYEATRLVAFVDRLQWAYDLTYMRRETHPHGNTIMTFNSLRGISSVLSTVLVCVLCRADSTFAQPVLETAQVDVKRKPTDAAWKPMQTRYLAEHAAATTPVTERSRFGGRTDQRFEATGFFYVHKTIDGRFTLVDPGGFGFMSVGMCAVNPNPTQRGKAKLAKRFGDRAGWARATAKQLTDAGFNTLGCWSNWQLFNDADAPMPYTTQLNLMSGYGKQRGGTHQLPGHTGYPNSCIFVFDPGFEAYARQYTAELLEKTKNDPWLLGHFSDNELPFKKDSLTRYLSLPQGDPGRKAAEDWWAKRRGGSQREPDKADQLAFVEFVAKRYYRIVSEAIKAADPNHLYLGSRLIGGTFNSDAVLRASAPYVDVLTANYYYAWNADPKLMDKWVRLTGRPFIITEWYAKGVDSGMANTSGAGWLVNTQDDRGRFYQNFALSLLEHPGCVGWHWFKYIDNDPTNTTADPSNRDSNKGIVTNLYEPYTPLIRHMTRLNRHVYTLRDTLNATHRVED